MRQDLSPAVDDYLRLRGSQDYAPATIRIDRAVLKRFLDVNGNIGCHQLTERHVSRHFEEASRTKASNSLKNDHATLGRFFKWCRHTGRMPVDSDPMFGRRPPKTRTKERNRIPVTDFARLLDLAGERSPRDRALVAVLLYTLMRDGEASALRIRDVDLNGGWLKATIEKSRTEDLVPICAELDRELRQWLTSYTNKVGPLQPHYFLLPPRIARPIHDGRGKIARHEVAYRPEHKLGPAARILQPLLEGIGHPTRSPDGKSLNEGAHTIRRSGARALFDQLVDGGYDHGLRVVQSMLHHKSITMTERYVGISADRRSRDEIIKGRVMYRVERDNVVELVR